MGQAERPSGSLNLRRPTAPLRVTAPSISYTKCRPHPSPPPTLQPLASTFLSRCSPLVRADLQQQLWKRSCQKLGWRSLVWLGNLPTPCCSESRRQLWKMGGASTVPSWIKCYKATNFDTAPKGTGQAWPSSTQRGLHCAVHAPPFQSKDAGQEESHQQSSSNRM